MSIPQRANSQPTPTHAGGDHKFSAVAAFGAPMANFGGGGVSENPAARPARAARALEPPHYLILNSTVSSAN